jgi:hypothetical protein
MNSSISISLPDVQIVKEIIRMDRKGSLES